MGIKGVDPVEGIEHASCPACRAAHLVYEWKGAGGVDGYVGFNCRRCKTPMRVWLAADVRDMEVFLDHNAAPPPARRPSKVQLIVVAVIGCLAGLLCVWLLSR